MKQAESQWTTVKCQTVPYLEAAKARGNIQDEITERWLTNTKRGQTLKAAEDELWDKRWREENFEEFCLPPTTPQIA